MLLPTFLLALAVSARAGIHSQAVTYKDGDTVLEGWLAYDDANAGKRPGVLVVHQWKGLGDGEKKRAEMLAQLGYVAFCADIYGQGIRPTSSANAGKEAGKYKSDRALLRQRVNAALTKLRRQPQIDPARVAAIGYCFGGTTVLELARSGADVAGVVSFHGGLDSPNPADGKRIRGKVLILHGARGAPRGGCPAVGRMGDGAFTKPWAKGVAPRGSWARSACFTRWKNTCAQRRPDRHCGRPGGRGQAGRSWRACAGRWNLCVGRCSPRADWARPLTTPWPAGKR